MKLGCVVVLLVDVAVDNHVHVHVHVVRTTMTQPVRRGPVREQGLQRPLLNLPDGTSSPTVSPLIPVILEIDREWPCV